MDVTPPRRRLNGGNVLLIVFGVLLILAALNGLQWYTADESGPNIAGAAFTFDDLHANAVALGAAVAGAYFDWLAWSLLLAAGVFALAANLPVPAVDALRVVAFLAGLLGLVGTYYALAQLFDAQQAAGGADHPVWHNASFGAWAAFAGFALVTIGGTLGPKRV